MVEQYVIVIDQKNHVVCHNYILPDEDTTKATHRTFGSCDFNLQLSIWL